MATPPKHGRPNQEKRLKWWLDCVAYIDRQIVVLLSAKEGKVVVVVVS